MLFENIAEIVGIAKPGLVCNVRAFHGGVPQKLLRFFKANPGQVLDKIFPGFLGEYRTQMIGADTHMGCGRVQGQIRIGKTPVNIFLGPYNHRLVSAGSVGITVLDHRREQGFYFLKKKIARTDDALNIFLIEAEGRNVTDISTQGFHNF